MTAPSITGSGLERVAVCAASGVLPRSETLSDDAERGHQIHGFLEAANRLGREAALDTVTDEMRPFCEALDLAKFPVDPTRYAAEVAFAYHVESGAAREIGRGIARRYDVKDGEVPGTVDVVALLEDDGVFVADFKSGWSRRVRARDSHQLRFYALAAARAYGRTRAVVQVIRVFSDGETWTDEAAFSAFDLDEYAMDLQGFLLVVEGHRKLFAEGVEPPIVEGAHCRWCPCFARCPAKTALVRSAAGLMVDPAELTPEIAAQAYEKVKLYKAAVERAEEIVREYARSNPLPLGDGQVYGVRWDETKKLDGRVAQAALEAIFGEAAREAVTVEVTQAGIKRAVKAHLAQHPEAGTERALVEQALAEITRRGGLRIVKAPKLVAHTPRAA